MHFGAITLLCRDLRFFLRKLLRSEIMVELFFLTNMVSEQRLKCEFDDGLASLSLIVIVYKRSPIELRGSAQNENYLK